MMYTEYIKRRIDLQENKVPWNFGHKYDTHQFCNHNSIPVPELYANFEKIEDIELRDLPSKFVLKPSYSSTSKGVLVLERVSSDSYFDHMTGLELTETDIRDIQRNVYDSHPRAKRKYTMAEEYVIDSSTGGVPEDYKFLAFQGIIGLIIKINRNDKKLTMSYFDSEFRPIYDNRIVFNSKLADLTVAETPRNWKRLLDVATRASYVVPTPFARIDLFDSTRGPVLGEITLTPGSFYYPTGHVLSAEENQRLGSLWKDSEIRLWGKPTV